MERNLTRRERILNWLIFWLDRRREKISDKQWDKLEQKCS